MSGNDSAIVMGPTFDWTKAMALPVGAVSTRESMTCSYNTSSKCKIILKKAIYVHRLHMQGIKIINIIHLNKI